MSATQPEGYLALPPAGTGHAVLVLHAWWGLNMTIKGFCDQLAEAGFVAFAPDLYHGQVTDQIAEAESLSAAMEAAFDQARAEVAQAATFLRNLNGTEPTGMTVIGFSLGAFYALDLAVSAPAAIQAVVLFYGTSGTYPLDFSKSNAAFLGHFADADPYEPAANVNSLAEVLQQAGRPVTFYTYNDTSHWFFEPDRADAYNPSAASLAWDRTLAFLRQSAT